MSAPTLTREQVVRHRAVAQGLDREPGSLAAADVGALDLGLQDTGPDGALWALALRGARVRADAPPAELVLLWSLRGAPHLYRRADLPDVAATVRPFSHADAASRVVSAAKPLRAAGVRAGDALARVAAAQRAAVSGPTVKGDLSGAVSSVLPPEYLRDCPACGVVHVYENAFRLAALWAGLELEPGTSPPVLRPLPGGPPEPAAELSALPDSSVRGEVRPGPVEMLRRVLRRHGPTRPQEVAALLDAPLAEVRAHWPAVADELVEVTVEGEPGPRWLPAGDLPAAQAAATGRDVRLLGPYDPLLAARDRALLVPDAALSRALWPSIGRPGAVLRGGDVVGTWRPRAAGTRLRLAVDAWTPWTTAVERAVDAEGERLAEFRGLTWAGRA